MNTINAPAARPMCASQSREKADGSWLPARNAGKALKKGHRQVRVLKNTQAGEDTI
jgi:hypothetical protein